MREYSNFSMTERRQFAAAAYHHDVGFLVTGGYGNGYLSSTEVSTDGTNFQVEIVFSINMVNI